MTSAIQSSSPNAPSLLGERQVHIPIAGRIRAGIKRLTNNVKNNPQAIDIYERGIEAGVSYEAIEKRIMQTCGFTRSPLIPQNVDYFSVKPVDFSMPEVADRIMDKYAEDKGDGLHLYRIPVIFATDAWQTNMPHGLKCFTRSELRYWSEYDASGARYCKTRISVESDEKNKRAKRPFGGRPVALRQENNGTCTPEACPEYQKRQCTLSGSLIFYIPGIPGPSAIELPTTSFYSMQQLRQQMEMVGFLRGGKISGTLEGRPIFWLTKKQEVVSMINENGQAQKVKQFLVHLEADIPTEHLFTESELQASPITAGSDAASILGSHPKNPEELSQNDDFESTTFENTTHEYDEF